MLGAKNANRTILPADESGQSLLEYIIIAALIALIALASVSHLGTTVGQVFSTWTKWSSDWR